VATFWDPTGWWDDVAANDDGHCFVTPRSVGSVDTSNMLLIENALPRASQ
jgi:hypothetical protein